MPARQKRYAKRCSSCLQSSPICVSKRRFAVTGGGPARATEILVFKVFRDGFVGLDLGRSAAQSVILMAIVIGFTVAQFRYVERKVHY